MSKKAYFFKKKHRKDKPEIKNISYLQMVGWNRMKGIEEEPTLLCMYLFVQFDFKTLLMFHTFKNEIKSTNMRKNKIKCKRKPMNHISN